MTILSSRDALRVLLSIDLEKEPFIFSRVAVAAKAIGYYRMQHELSSTSRPRAT